MAEPQPQASPPTGAYASLPAWARTFARSTSALRRPGSLPFPHLPAGHPTPGLEQIEHVVVLMMENHSFDNLLGMVPHQVTGRTKVDGLTVKGGRVVNSNPSSVAPYAIKGPQVVRRDSRARPARSRATPLRPGTHRHLSWNNGQNNGFVQASTAVAMWYWDKHSLPTTYSLAQHYPIGQRYFCSVLAQTYPNRRFFFCGTASGLTATNNYAFTYDGGQRHDLQPAARTQHQLAQLRAAISGEQRTDRARVLALTGLRREDTSDEQLLQ